MKNKFVYFILCLLIIFTSLAFVFFNTNDTVAIIGAMDVEIKEVLANLNNKSQQQHSDFKIITGNLGKHKVILSESGVGKVASATTTQYIIDKYKPNYIINIGLAGGLSPKLKDGDTIIAEKMVQHDFDLTAFGKPKGYMDKKFAHDKPTIYYSDKTLISKFSKDSSLKLGVIATGDIFIADKKLKQCINEEFEADAADMESAAIAQTAKRNNIPVIIIRTISDSTNDSTNEYKINKTELAKLPALKTVSILRQYN